MVFIRKSISFDLYLLLYPGEVTVSAGALFTLGLTLLTCFVEFISWLAAGVIEAFLWFLLITEIKCSKNNKLKIVFRNFIEN